MKIKPCPRCGKPAWLGWNDKPGIFVRCSECDYPQTEKYKSKLDAMIEWNMRPEEESE